MENLKKLKDGVLIAKSISCKIKFTKFNNNNNVKKILDYAMVKKLLMYAPLFETGL